MIPGKTYQRISDLLQDDGFLAWWLEKHHPYRGAWNRWVSENPFNHTLASEAGSILSELIALQRTDQATMNNALTDICARIKMYEESDFFMAGSESANRLN